jgi:ribosome-binding protein aMBF1 (putative translation factor)
MTKIKKYVADIAEELNSSKAYMEIALEYKALGDSTRYARYKEMSIQELAHAMTLHDYAVQDIEQLKTVYPEIPQKMLEKWDHSHIDFVEKAAWIKQMQSM